MPIIAEKIDGNLKTVSYQESPIMSTYLVAVVVGLFDYVEDHTLKRGKNLKDISLEEMDQLWNEAKSLEKCEGNLKEANKG